MENVLKTFNQYLQEIGYSRSTQRSIAYCTQEFIAFVSKEIGIIAQEDIIAFYNYIKERPSKRGTGALSESFVQHNIYAVKVFFNWLEATNKITENPTSNLLFKRPASNSRTPLTQEEIQQLFHATESLIEKALLHLFYSCGLRRTEAVNLNTDDIHFSKNVLYVRNGKGAKRRAVPINESVKQGLYSYLLQRANPNSIEAFMINQIYRRMSGNSYNAALKQLVGKSNIERTDITLHHLRHSIATHLLENGMGIEFVRDFLGHKYLEATQIYTKVSRQLVSSIKT